jgi:hypothetical protein
MAEFQGAVDGFVLLRMESDERQNNKMYMGLEDRLLCPVAACSEPLYDCYSCMN